MEQESPNLPMDIISSDILPRLPVKPLCRFKSVSKEWQTQLTSPGFAKSQLNQFAKDNQAQKLILASNTRSQSMGSSRASNISHSVYTVDYQSRDHTVAKLELPGESTNVELMGSSNGIILLGIDDELCLWNPSIRMCRKFPQPRSLYRAMLYGLGYDYGTDDFKVVRVSMPGVNHPCTVHMFTSKLSSWKSIGNFDYAVYHDRPGTVLNGKPHWLWNRRTDGTSLALIVCFDATEERFMEVPQPNYEGGGKCLELGILGGQLCVVQGHADRSDVWVLKEYGVEESWTKLFVVPKGSGVVSPTFYCLSEQLFCTSFMPLYYANDREVVMILDSVKLVIYNPKEKRHRSIEIPQDCLRFDVALYVESLVSPPGGVAMV